MDILKSLTTDDVQTLFGKKHAQNVQAHWPILSAALRTAGWAEDEVMVAYALATVRAETGNFLPREEGAHAGIKSADGRDFGVYDAVAVDADGQPRIGFYKDKSLRLTSSGLGNRPHLKGSWLDPEVSGENQWRVLKGLPPRSVEASEDGKTYRGRGFVQLTGRDNYTAAGKALGLKLVDKPELACEAANAARIMVWYLKPRATRIRANLSGETPDFLEARAAVNGKNPDGSVNGLEHFTTAYEAAIALIQARKQAAEQASAKPTPGGLRPAP